MLNLGHTLSSKFGDRNIMPPNKYPLEPTAADFANQAAG